MGCHELGAPAAQWGAPGSAGQPQGLRPATALPPAWYACSRDPQVLYPHTVGHAAAVALPLGPQQQRQKYASTGYIPCRTELWVTRSRKTYTGGPPRAAPRHPPPRIPATVPRPPLHTMGKPDRSSSPPCSSAPRSRGAPMHTRQPERPTAARSSGAARVSKRRLTTTEPRPHNSLNDQKSRRGRVRSAQAGDGGKRR